MGIRFQAGTLCSIKAKNSRSCREFLYKADISACFRDVSVYDELSEFKVAVIVTLDEYFTPRKLRKVNAEKAFSVEPFVSRNEMHFAGIARCNTVKLDDVSV